MGKGSVAQNLSPRVKKKKKTTQECKIVAFKVVKRKDVRSPEVFDTQEKAQPGDSDTSPQNHPGTNVTMDCRPPTGPAQLDSLGVGASAQSSGDRWVV